MSSTKGMFTSLRGKSGSPSAAPPIPSAFPQKENNFGPPPVRRVTSTSSKSGTKSVSPAPPPAPPRRKEPEGEWAEVLYDYTSDDPDDLPLEEGQRVLIVDRSSDDWYVFLIVILSI